VAENPDVEKTLHDTRDSIIQSRYSYAYEVHQMEDPGELRSPL
jgi:hypothetical protein